MARWKSFVGADGLYRRAAAPLRAAYALLDAGATRQTTADRLHSGAGELAISVGWLAHDSGRYDDARSHYAEALATARVTDDPALVNGDAEGTGWFCKLKFANPAELDGLMDAAAYRAFVESQS